MVIKYKSGLDLSVLNKEAPWDTVMEFALWYQRVGFPMIPSSDGPVVTTDDAVAFPVFRYKNFQAELYVFTPSTVPKHAHPYVDVVQTYFHPASGAWTEFVELIYPQAHGGDEIVLDTALQNSKQLLLTLQKWPDGQTPHTLSAVWKGPTMGPLQEGLVRQFNPDCLLYPGYADITVKAQASAIL
jgi:hypothetical protein